MMKIIQFHFLTRCSFVGELIVFPIFMLFDKEIVGHFAVVITNKCSTFGLKLVYFDACRKETLLTGWPVYPRRVFPATFASSTCYLLLLSTQRCWFFVCLLLLLLLCARVVIVLQTCF